MVWQVVRTVVIGAILLEVGVGRGGRRLTDGRCCRCRRGRDHVRGLIGARPAVVHLLRVVVAGRTAQTAVHSRARSPRPVARAQRIDELIGAHLLATRWVWVKGIWCDIPRNFARFKVADSRCLFFFQTAKRLLLLLHGKKAPKVRERLRDLRTAPVLMMLQVQLLSDSTTIL